MPWAELMFKVLITLLVIQCMAAMLLVESISII